MDETKLILNLKNMRKAAFAVGVGFTVGKTVGGYASAVMNGVGLGILKSLAKHGNQIAQETCKHCDIEYKKGNEQEKKSDEIKMGFHM